MSEQSYELTTDQAEREASGAHAYGRYLEEFEVGAVYKHWPAKTVTFHGDTLFCETEVLEVKPSKSKPDRGVVKVHTRVLNQDGVLVAEFKRLVLVPRREPGE